MSEGREKINQGLILREESQPVAAGSPQRSGLECPAGTAVQSFASALIFSGGQKALRLAGERFARQLAPDLDSNRKLL